MSRSTREQGKSTSQDHDQRSQGRTRPLVWSGRTAGSQHRTSHGAVANNSDQEGARSRRDSNRREAITSRSNSQQDRRTEQKKGKLSSHRVANLNTQSHFGLKASPQEMRM